LRDFFEQAGPVTVVRLIRDRSGRSKGFGYVEFEELEDVPKALLLHGQLFCMRHRHCSCSGFPLLVRPSGSEKNYAALAEGQGSIATGSTDAGGMNIGKTADRLVYVGNLSPTVTESELRTMAQAIGPVDRVLLIRDDRGQSKGIAALTFLSADSARRALDSLNGIAVGDRALRVGVLDPLQGTVRCPSGDSFSLNVGGKTGAALSNLSKAALLSQLSSATAQAAQQLGHTLAAAASAAAASAGIALVPGSVGAASGATTTPCLLVNNLYSPAEESDPRWEDELREVVEEEAERVAPGSRVLHCHVAREMGEQGAVYLMFSDVTGAVQAACKFSGRYFGGRQLRVQYVELTEYLSRFPEVARMAQR
jgi:hypothetical protein